MKTSVLMCIIGMILLVGCNKQAINISEIKVRERNLNIIQIINQSEKNRRI